MKNILIVLLLLVPFFGATQTLMVRDQKNKKISGLTLNNIVLVNDTNVIIAHCNIKNSTKVAIQITGCSNVTVKFDSIADVLSGVVATLGDNIKIDSNYMHNINGKFNHDVQFDEVKGGEIVGNDLQNDPGASSVEDVINLYKSNGTQRKPVLVSGNRIKGGGPSASGSGIMLGDGGGSWQMAIGNILVNPGQVGIGVAGGNHIIVSNNVIYGTKQSFTNLGVYAWNQSTSPCNNITINNNLINFTAAKGYLNNYWDGGNCGIINWGTNKYNSGLNATILPGKL